MHLATVLSCIAHQCLDCRTGFVCRKTILSFRLDQNETYIRHVIYKFHTQL
jgi:hypothetical protein